MLPRLKTEIIESLDNAIIIGANETWVELQTLVSVVPPGEWVGGPAGEESAEE